MSEITKAYIDELIKAYNEGHPLISDEEYDSILETYLAQNKDAVRPFSRTQQTDIINELVCTLPKVYNNPRDNQKTYSDWLRTSGVSNKSMLLQPKFDGCSIAYDFTNDKLLTRGDYDNGESEDVSSLFDHTKIKINDITENDIGCKFEAIMSEENFIELNKSFEKPYKRARDMAQAIIRSGNIELCKFITLVPLRVLDNNHNQRVALDTENLSIAVSCTDTDRIAEFIDDILADGAKVEYNGQHYAIDGVVATVDQEHEVAIKILNNIKETKIKNIEYQYGRTGKITPVGILEPVYFDNVKVDHVGLSTLDRVMELNLCYDDTVRIVYNIVPYLIDSQHDGTTPIPIPTRCPICGAEFNTKTLKTVRCTNPHCKGLKIGMITRYCEQLKMMGVSKKTISRLFEAGIIENIADLYKITKEDIMNIPGYKEKSAENIIDSIWKSSRDVKVSRWLGALPIKDISAKTWQVIINATFNGDEMVASNVIKHEFENGNVDSFMNACLPTYIYGISQLTFSAIREGLTLYWDDIKAVTPFISFNILTKISNKPSKGRVTLTGTRDSKLIAYLTDCGYEVNDFNSKTIALVIPDSGYVSSKVVKAKKAGIPIYTVDEAYKALS